MFFIGESLLLIVIKPLRRLISLAGESVAVEYHVHYFSCARKIGGIKLSPEKTLLFNQTKYRKVKVLFFYGESVAVGCSHIPFRAHEKFGGGLRLGQDSQSASKKYLPPTLPAEY